MEGIKQKDFDAVDSALRDAIGQVETLRSAAEEYKEARSEKWCESEAGEEYENKIEQIGDVICTLNDAADDLRALIEGD